MVDIDESDNVLDTGKIISRYFFLVNSSNCIIDLLTLFLATGSKAIFGNRMR